MLERREDVQAQVDDQVDRAMTRAAILEQSSIGHVAVEGPDRLDFLHRLSTNDLLGLHDGDIAPTVFVTEKGRIIDYVHLLIGESRIDILTSSGIEDRLVAWLERYHIMEDLTLSVRTTESAMQTIVGPFAGEFAARLLAADLPPNRYVTVPLGDLVVRAANIHDPHAHMVVLMVQPTSSDRFRQMLIGPAAAEQIPVMGTQGYGVWKCLSGVPSLGTELSDSYNPLEADLRHAISFLKGCYIGQEVIARLDTYQKVQRHLVGGELETSSGVRNGTQVFSTDEEEIGHLTSVAEVPFGGGYPVLAMIRKEWAQTGRVWVIHTDSGLVHGTMTKVF